MPSHHMIRPWRKLLCLSGIAFLMGGAQGAALNLGQPVAAQCPRLYAAVAGSPKQCEFNRPDTTEAECSPSADFAYDAAKKACTAKQQEVPAICPVIAGYTSKVITVPASGSTPAQARCEYDRPEAPSTSAADYIGDCFHLKTNVGDLKAGSRWFVTDQPKDPALNNDPVLTMVPGVTWETGAWAQGFMPGWIACRAAESNMPAVTAQASQLAASGATRRGYAYGVLTMPYKYFPGAKTFIDGTPIGAYMGWRVGQPGSAVTYAVAATLGSVTADTIDPNVKDANDKPKVTGNTHVMSLSWAAGMLFEVSRSPTGKAFRTGLFVGRDHINPSENIRYEHNNKTWVAVQIGFDFTDY